MNPYPVVLILQLYGALALPVWTSDESPVTDDVRRCALTNLCRLCSITMHADSSPSSSLHFVQIQN